MDPRDPHPWDDPQQAPRYFDRALEPPALGVDPSDFADFHDYQMRLALHNQMLHEGALEGGVSVRANNSAGRGKRAPLPRPSTEEVEELVRALDVTSGDAVKREVVFRAFCGFCSIYEYVLDAEDFGRLAEFVRQARDKDPLLYQMLLRVGKTWATHKEEALKALTAAKSVAAAARKKRNETQQRMHEVDNETAPTPRTGVSTWLPWVRRENERIRREDMDRKNLPYRLSEYTLQLSSLEGREDQARQDAESETVKLERWENVMARV